MNYTIEESTEGIYKEKGSKFISYAFPIKSSEDLKGFLQEVKDLHPKARHFCYALRLIENEEEYYLVNDDGEPNHSAGTPILGQIKSKNISHVLIIVLRYFGGTKLGISGLVKAYKSAALDCLEKARLIEIKHTSVFEFQIPYEYLGEIMSIIDKNPLHFSMEENSNSAKISLSSEQLKLDEIKALFSIVEQKFIN